MKMRLVPRGGLVAAGVAAILLVGAVPAAAAPGDGSARGAIVDVTLLGQPAVSAGPFAAADTDGPTTDTFAAVNVPGVLSTGVIQTSATRDDSTGAVNSFAQVADVDVLLAGALGGISADAVRAECNATDAGITGSTTLTNINLGGLGTVAANPAPNTVINVGVAGINVARVTFNEQNTNADGSLTVNAVHIRLLGGVLGSLGTGDIFIARARCGPAALPVPMASGAGLWLGLGLLALIAVPMGITVRRRRTGLAVA